MEHGLQKNAILKSALEAMEAAKAIDLSIVPKPLDEFDKIGDFVASNMRKWSQQSQAKTSDFQTNLYGLIFQTQKEIAALQNSQIVLENMQIITVDGEMFSPLESANETQFIEAAAVGFDEFGNKIANEMNANGDGDEWKKIHWIDQIELTELLLPTYLLLLLN